MYVLRSVYLTIEFSSSKSTCIVYVQAFDIARTEALFCRVAKESK